MFSLSVHDIGWFTCTVTWMPVVQRQKDQWMQKMKIIREALFFVWWGGSLFCGRIFWGSHLREEKSEGEEKNVGGRRKMWGGRSFLREEHFEGGRFRGRIILRVDYLEGGASLQILLPPNPPPSKTSSLQILLPPNLPPTNEENHQIFSHKLTLPPLFPPSNEANHGLSSHKIGSHQFFSHKWGKGVLGMWVLCHLT